MRGLEKGDKYWLISIDPPIELEEKSFEEAAVKAAKNDAKINYVSLPDITDDEWNDEFARHITGLGNYQSTKHSFSIGTEFSLWKEQILNEYGKDIEENLNHYIVNPDTGMLFMSPYVKYVFIEHKEKNDEAWLDAAYVGATLKDSGQKAEERASLRLRTESIRLLKNWVETEATLKKRL
jgi:hypothetical protein